MKRKKLTENGYIRYLVSCRVMFGDSEYMVYKRFEKQNKKQLL